MKKILLVVFATAAVVASAQESWLGLFTGGKQIGYSSNLLRGDKLGGRAMTRSDTHTLIRAGLLGTAMTMDIKSSTWTTGGKPKRMVFRIESSGRVQSLDARFGAADIRVAVKSTGSTVASSTAVLPLPKDGAVVDDALTAASIGGKPIKAVRSFYVLDPMTISLVKNTVTPMGSRRVNVLGRTVQATRIDISEPRSVMKVYLDRAGALLKAEGPLGIDMIPMTKSKALAAGDGPRPDLAAAASVAVNKEIEDVPSIKALELRVTGKDLSRLPSDEHQTVRREGDAWDVTVHPVEIGGLKDSTIASAAKEKPEWTKPSLYIPAARPNFRSLAARIVGNSKTVLTAARKIQSYVYESMKYNAGIGVLRDAGEVLKSKEGVCRDYAILTTTLLRSAGIPARVAGGMVYAEGRFYYHAWSEAWDGTKWVGVDSTRPERQITATHVKLADGNVDQAFMFTFLGDAKIEVGKVER